MSHSIEAGPLYLNIHRTFKVKNTVASNLPPSLGLFEIFKVADYKICPESWDKEAYFIAISKNEALWLNFQSLSPIAILISADGVNVVSGDKFENNLNKDNYLVSPPQAWLDGWKGKDGEIYQFVATNENTVGEQLGASEHYLTISVFEPKDKKLVRKHIMRPNTNPCSSNSCCRGICQDFGLGKGYNIKQKIYEDPHGLEVWNNKPAATVKIYMMEAEVFSALTGRGIEAQIKVEDYKGPWYNVEDSHIPTVTGVDKLETLKNA